jgi:hypothetical protein
MAESSFHLSHVVSPVQGIALKDVVAGRVSPASTPHQSAKTRPNPKDISDAGRKPIRKPFKASDNG